MASSALLISSADGQTNVNWIEGTSNAANRSDWNRGANWSTGAAPTGITNVAVFGVQTQQSPSALATALTIGGFSLTGGQARSLTFNNTVALDQYGVDNSSTFSFSIGGTGNTNLTAAQTWAITNTGNTTFSKSIVNGGNLLTLNATSSGTGVISSLISGTGGITKTGAGAGSWTLSGANTFTGAVTIFGGVLSVATIGNGGVAGNLGQASNLASNLVLSGGTLRYSGSTASTDRSFTLGAGTTGTIDVSAGATTLTMSGSSASTSGALTKAGVGTLELTGANAHTGNTLVNSGVLRITNGSGLGTTASGTTVAAGAALELSGGISVGAESLAISGSGIASGGALRSISGNNAYGGAISSSVASLITADTGTLTLNGLLTNTAATTLGGGGNLVIAGGIGGGDIVKTGAGTLTLAVGNSQANTTVNQGQLNVNHLAALGTPAGTLTMAAGTSLDNTSGASVTVTNPKSINLGSSLTFVGSNDLNLGNGLVTLSGNTQINVTSSQLTFGGNVAGTGFGITKTGLGTLRLDGLTGSGSFTGNSFVNAGTLVIGGTSTLGGSGSTVVTVADGAFLRIESGASSGNVTLSSRPDGLITSTVVNANQSFNSSGALTASNANFNGTTELASGVTIEAASNLFGIVPTETSAGRIQFQNNSTLRVTSGFTIAQTQGINLAGGTTNFEVNPNQALITESSITGSGGIVKLGGGNMRLTGVNSYTGGTVVSSGILGITSGSALGAESGALKLDGGTVVGAQVTSGAPITDVTIATGRSVVLSNGKTSGMDAQTGLSLRYDGVIAQEVGAGAAAGLRIGSSAAREGTVILGGSNTYTGATTIDFGTLSVSDIGNGGVASNIGASGNAASNLVLGGGILRYTGNSASTDRSFTLSSNTTSGINIANQAATLTLSGSSAATSGALNKTGLGTLLMTGANSHSGATNVAGGRLIVNGSTSAQSAVGVSSGATLAGSGTIGGNTTIASGGVLAPGNSPGVITVSGSTTLESGSIFEWELDTAQSNPETNRGIAYDGVNTNALIGTGAIFKIILTGTQDFADAFWETDRTWTDIFKSADGTTNLTDWASVFSGGFQYSYNGKTAAPAGLGTFSVTGNSLSWSAVPEPTNALAGLLAASALLRRSRQLVKRSN